ncbi:MAG: hypothetical protein QXF01_02400 [Candidatus Micrarchaeaceae archaeon]
MRTGLIARKVRIETSPSSCFASASARFEPAIQEEPEEVLQSLFNSEAEARLVISGLYDAVTGRSLKLQAAEKLGLLELDDFGKLRISKTVGLSVVAWDYEQFTSRLREYRYASGVMLAYLLDCRVSVLLASAD